MKQLLSLIALFAVLCGCGDKAPEAPVKLNAKEQDAVAIARRAVAQFEGWGDRAEYRIERRGALWRVTAWLVVHPEAKGNQRYAPWSSMTAARWSSTCQVGEGHRQQLACVARRNFRRSGAWNGTTNRVGNQSGR